MSAKGCYRNAVVDSFLSSLQHELVLNDDAEIQNSPQQLIRKFAWCIVGYCSRESHLSTPSHLSPITCGLNHIKSLRLGNAEP